MNVWTRSNTGSYPMWVYLHHLCGVHSRVNQFQETGYIACILWILHLTTMIGLFPLRLLKSECWSEHSRVINGCTPRIQILEFSLLPRICDCCFIKFKSVKNYLLQTMCSCYRIDSFHSVLVLGLEIWCWKILHQTNLFTRYDFGPI